MDYSKLINRYRQFGGLHLVWQYTKLGILPVVMKEFFCCLIKRQSFKAIYPEVLKKVEPMLIAKYGPRVQEFKKFNSSRVLEQEHPKVIWWCWLQGIENAPDIVRASYNSLVGLCPSLLTLDKVSEFPLSSLNRSLQGSSEDGYEIRVIDAENWKDYVELPDYIVKKWEKKQIPPALFTDLLRLQLLIKYGGTWIDSTVLCTLDFSSWSSQAAEPSVKFQGSSAQKYLDADLFLFQYTPEETTKDISISNWFISAHSNNEVLMTLREMLFAYWKDYNCTLDYYIFHLFFAMVAKEYPEQIAAMPYGYSMNSLVLLHHWDESFDQKKWDKLTKKVCFHKLAFRIDRKTKENKNNFYNYILNTNKEIENGRI